LLELFFDLCDQNIKSMNDPLYSGIIERRRQRHRLWFGAVLLVAGSLLMIVSLTMQSIPMVISGILVMVIANYLFGKRKAADKPPAIRPRTKKPASNAEYAVTAFAS
jgi:hypothetical protein